jgi:hypothetical protein
MTSEEELRNIEEQLELDRIQLKRQNKKAEENVTEILGLLRRVKQTQNIKSSDRRANLYIKTISEDLDELINKYERLIVAFKRELTTIK